MLGEVIKDFVLIKPLGKGGMGEVWAAEQQLIKTRVAIKLLLAGSASDRPQVQRFFNEAIAVSKISHAGIAKIYDVGFHGDRPFLIMEMLEGETLATRIARIGRLPPVQVAEIGRQITSILQATHAAGRSFIAISSPKPTCSSSPMPSSRARNASRSSTSGSRSSRAPMRPR